MTGRIEHPLPPLFDASSHILILGSFPSVKTREAGFFYGHPQNRFWPLMSRLLEVTPPLRAAEPERARRILLARGIALWDSIASCEISGSSDSSIRAVVLTELGPIFAQTRIRQVFCNGATAWRYFRAGGYQIAARQLPSTSPANARWSFEALVEAWQVILDFLD